MWARSLAFVGVLLVAGCAYDAREPLPEYAKDPRSTAGYYSPIGYSQTYVPGSAVYGAPYVSGPVMGGIYVEGDAADVYGGPVFSPFYGIRCDRRPRICWGQYGPDPRWTGRFFGHPYASNENGTWNGGRWNGRDWGDGPGNPGGSSANGNRPYVYQVPKHPDGSGAPTFLPNGCGGNGQPPC